MGAASFSFAYGLFLALKYTLGIRVSETEELDGLDIHEHGMHAYPDMNDSNTYGRPERADVPAEPVVAKQQHKFPLAQPAVK